MVKQDRSLAEKIYEAIKALFGKLTGEGFDSVRTELTEAQKLWADMLESEKTKNTAQKDGEVRYDLKNVNGKSIVWIEHSDLTSKQLSNHDAVAAYIAQHIGEVYTIIESGQRVYIGDDLPSEYTHSKYTDSLRKRNPGALRAKNRAANELGLLIETATNRRWEKTKHAHNKDAKYGVYRYDSTFAFPVKSNQGNTTGVKAFDVELVIRNASDGKKYLYDIVNLKENTADAIDLQQRETRLATYKAASQGSASKLSVAQDEASVKVGVTYDEKTESVSPVRYSLDTWNESDYVTARADAAKAMSEALGITQKKAKAYVDSVNSIAKMIANDRVRLDYEASPGRSSFVSNAEYGGSIDFSTICKKRRLFTGTFEAIQKALPNTALTAEEFLEIRSMMDEKGYEVSCGLCYVEGSRANMGQYAKQFLEQYEQTSPEYLPNMAEINTPDGLERIRAEHPEVYAAYEKFMNGLAQRKPKLYQTATAYQGEVLNKFGRRGGKVEEKNYNGGLRLQSFSDFEIIHLIDCMQVIMDMSRVGLAGQAYTKVPDFAWALGDTGLKINLSLISKGVDSEGKIILDEKEGMSAENAFALRDRYSENVGTVLVVFSDEQLKAALADERIDYVLPFHRSQWRKDQYDTMGLPADAKDYTPWQNESYIKPVLSKSGKKQRPDNFMPNTYWDFSKSGKENAETYLRMCAEGNRKPKFSHLLVNNKDGSYSLQPDGSTDGYWKLLIDFKMYDNNGKGVPQRPVRPDFNMEQANRMLEEYKGGHSRFPAADDVVSEFVEQYKRNHPGVRYSVEETDSDGNKLSKQQIEFFKDSKVRDEQGRLIPVYHGTPAGGFTEFKLPEYLSGLMNAQGAGFYFTDEANARQYMKPVNKTVSGRKKLYKTYLNITNPLVIKQDSPVSISKEQFKDIVRRGNYGWFRTTGMPFQAGRNSEERTALQSTPFEEVLDRWTEWVFRGAYYDSDILSDMTKAFKGDDEILSAMKEVLGYDGVRYVDKYGDIWVAWSPNQIKNTTNKKPTESSDIRYAVDSGSDEVYLDGVKTDPVDIIESLYNYDTVSLDRLVVDWNQEHFQYQWEKGYYKSVVDSISEHTGKSKQEIWNFFAPVLLTNTGIAKYDGKTYANIHETNEANLRKAFELGGLAAPSIGIVDVDKPTTGFGEIVLVFPDIFNPETTPTHYGDSYSSSFPPEAKFTDSTLLMDALTDGVEGMMYNDILTQDEAVDLVQDLDQIYFYDDTQRTSHTIQSDDGFANPESFTRSYHIRSIPGLVKLYEGLKDSYESYDQFLRQFAEKVFTDQRLYKMNTANRDYDWDARRFIFRDYTLDDAVEEMTANGEKDFGISLGERVKDYDELQSLGMRARLKSGSANYYESKPQRAVYINEASYAVVPDTASPDIVEMLEWEGVKVVRYTGGDGRGDASRIEAVKSILESDPDIRYSVDSDDDFDAAVQAAFEAAYQESLKNPPTAPASQADSEMLGWVIYNQSVGAAALRFDPYTYLLNEYGAIEQTGKHNHRVADVPKSTHGKDKVSKTTTTVMGAKATPEARLTTIAQAVVDGELSYEPIANKITERKMRNKLTKDGWDDTLASWTKAVHEGKSGADLVAMGATLLNNAGNSGVDGKVYIRLMTDYAQLLRNAGQSLQAANIFKKMSPEGKLYGIQKQIEEMNEDESYAPHDHGVPVSLWMDRVGELLADELYKRVDVKEHRDKVDTVCDTILKDLYDYAKTLVVKEPTVKGKVRTEMQRLQDLFDNKEKYAEAWQIAKNRLVDEFGTDPNISAALETFIQDELKIAKRLTKELTGQSDIVMSEALAERYLAAQTDEERGIVMEMILQDIANQVPATFTDKFKAWRYTAMLGNFRTMIRNVSGNALMQPVRSTKTVFAALGEALMQKAGVIDERTTGLTRDKETLKAAVEDFQNVKDIIAGGGRYRDDNSKTDLSAEIRKRQRVFKNALLEGYRKTTQWAMDNEWFGDEAFSRIAYRDALARYIAANGLTWSQASEELKDRARVVAIREAAESTYRDNNDFSDLVTSIRFRNSDTSAKKFANAMLEGVLPFKKTPANILVRSIEYSPIGFANAVRHTLAKNPDHAVTDIINEYAKGLTGTSILALGMGLAALGMIRGKAPDEEKEKELWEMQGHQEYSLEIGGTSYTIDWAAPLSIPLLVGAELFEALQSEGLTVREMSSVASSVFDPLLEMSMLQGINDAISNAQTWGDESALVRFTGNALWSYASQVVPTLLGQLERSSVNERTTTYADKNKDVPDAVQRALGKVSAKIPGWDHAQTVYIDAWGRTQANAANRGLNVLEQFFSPGYANAVTETAMEKELLRLKKVTGESGVLIASAPKYFTVDNARKDLTADEYLVYAVTRGQTSYNLLTEMTSGDSYVELTDAQKADAVKRAYDYANQIAKEQVTGGKYKVDNWVSEARTNATQLGLDVSTYLTAYAATKDLKSIKDTSGETVDNSLALRKAVAVLSVPGLTGEQRVALADALGSNKTVLGWLETNPNIVPKKLEALEKKYG